MAMDGDIFNDIAKENFIDDCWAKIFAMHIMCPCPDPQVKKLFIDFVLARYDYLNVDKITEQFVFRSFPKFINACCLETKSI